MALNVLKSNHLASLGFKGLKAHELGHIQVAKTRLLEWNQN